MAYIFQTPRITNDQPEAHEITHKADDQVTTEAPYGTNPTDAKTTTETYTIPAGSTVTVNANGDLVNSDGKTVGSAPGTGNTPGTGSAPGTYTAADIDREFGIAAPAYKSFTEPEPGETQYQANMKMMKQYLPTPISEEEQQKRARIGSAMQGLQAFSNGLSALAGLYSTGGGGYAMQIPQANTQTIHSWLNEQDQKRTQNAQLVSQAAGRDEAAYQQARANWLARKQAVDQYNDAEKATYETRHLQAVIAKRKEEQDAAAAKQKAEEAEAQRKSSEKIAAGHDATSERNNKRSNATSERNSIRSSQHSSGNSSKDDQNKWDTADKYQKARPNSVNEFMRERHIEVGEGGFTKDQRDQYIAWYERKYGHKPAAAKPASKPTNKPAGSNQGAGAGQQAKPKKKIAGFGKNKK